MTPLGRNIMHPVRIAFVISWILVAFGCDSGKRSQNISEPSPQSHQDADRWMVNQPFKDQSEAAIAQERVIYPGRFVSNSAKLNSLGIRDVQVISDAAGDGAVRIVVRRGNVSDELYADRVASVLTEFDSLGIATNRLQVTSMSDFGSGTPATEVIRIQKESRSQTLRPAQGEVLSPTGGSEVIR